MPNETFDQWLVRHRLHFQNYEGWEIARAAVACGFTMAEISPKASEWVTASRRRLRLWESPFFEKWMRVAKYERGMD